METEEMTHALLGFLNGSPNSYFAVANMTAMLDAAGFRRLREGEPWTLTPGADYYVTRNGSALAAFRLPAGDWGGFQIVASHSDSPTFQIKTNPELTAEGLTRLNVEGYGGMLCASWLDRPLSAAGRITVRTGRGTETRLVRLDRDLFIIPSLAIHMDRGANDGWKFNTQRDMLPLLGENLEPGAFHRLVAETAGVPAADLLDTDLFLYNRMPAAVVGLNGEFIAGPRLDDLQCAYASLRGLLAARPGQSAAVCCVFDNEEVGSGTKQGAAGTFLRDTLRRICLCAGGDGERWLRLLANSFLVSVDNSHAVHPAHPDKADPTNRPRLNGGVVLKYSAPQRYTTDGASGAVFRLLCEEAGVPLQTFFNRSDLQGGSTLGHISSSQVSVPAVDVGLAQLAMHSAYETAGARDTAYMARAVEAFFSRALRADGDGGFRIL